MIKDTAIYVDHMLDCIQRIDEYIDGKAHFYSSRLVQYAVVRNLQIMPESSQRIADDIKSAYPEVPRREISGFVNTTPNPPGRASLSELLIHLQ